MASEKRGPMKLVYIEWVDAYGCGSSWGEIEDLDAPPLTVTSVGWLLKDGDDNKVIVPHLSQPDHRRANQQGCGDMTIPTVAVTRMVELKVPK